MIGGSLKNIFDSIGFAYDFAFCQNSGSLKIFQNVLWKKSFKNANRYQSFLGGSSYKTKSTNIESDGSKFGKFPKFQKVEIWKIIFFKDDSMFSCILAILMIKRKCKGPLRVQKKSRCLKFPKSSKKYWNMSGDLN